MLKKKRILIILAVLILIIFVGLGFGSDYLFRYSMVSKAKSEYTYNNGQGSKSEAQPAMANVNNSAYKGNDWYKNYNLEKMSIMSDDGLKLVGYFLPANKKTNRLAVIAHGYGENAETRLNLIECYHEQGFNVFAPDDRAHGASEGKYIGMGWLDRKDYIKWIKTLINKLGSDTQIVLHGVSMGGATVMMLSGEKLPSNVKCIIEDCGYTSVKDEFGGQLKAQFNLPAFPLLDLASLESKLRVGYFFGEASALDAVKRTKLPILFIHGGADTYVPTKMVYKLYAADKSEKELWVVPGAAHTKAYETDTAGYKKHMMDFYNKYMSQ